MLCVIGGTSLFGSARFASYKPRTVETPYGNVTVHCDEANKRCFLQRHHADADRHGAYQPPHRINHKANVHALRVLGVERCVAVCCVGSLDPALAVGTLVIADDFNMVPLFGQVVTFFEDDARGHLVPGLDASLRADVIEAVCASGDNEAEEGEEESLFPDGVRESVRTTGTYVQTRGPRFETPAEVRVLRHYGDVIGMTAGSEAVLCREVGIKYAQVCMVDNYANGLMVGAALLSEDEFKANVARNQARVERVVTRVLTALERKYDR